MNNYLIVTLEKKFRLKSKSVGKAIYKFIDKTNNNYIPIQMYCNDNLINEKYLSKIVKKKKKQWQERNTIIRN